MGGFTRSSWREANAPAWPAACVPCALLLAASLPLVVAGLDRSYGADGQMRCASRAQAEASGSSLLQRSRAVGTAAVRDGVDAFDAPAAVAADVAAVPSAPWWQVWHGLPAGFNGGDALSPKAPPPLPMRLEYLTCGSRPLALASGAVALLSEMSFAALGFGPAVMYEIFWQLFYVVGVGSGHLEEAVWNSLIMSSAVAVVQAFWLRKHLNLRVAVLMTVPLVMGLPIGTLLLEHFGESRWIKKLLGAFFLTMVCLQGAGGAKARPQIEDLSLKTCGWAIFAAFVGGLSRGLFGVSAPVSVLLLFFSLDRDLWRLINAIYRIAIFAVQGSMLVKHLRPQQDCYLMYFTLVVGGMMGMVLGNMAAPKVGAADLQRWLAFFLATAGLLMLGDGHRELEIAAALVSVLTLLSMPLLAYVGKGSLELAKDGDEPASSGALPKPQKQ